MIGVKSPLTDLRSMVMRLWSKWDIMSGSFISCSFFLFFCSCLHHDVDFGDTFLSGLFCCSFTVGSAIEGTYNVYCNKNQKVCIV